MPLISREYCDGDEKQIVSLYNLVTNRNRSINDHIWEWLLNPHAYQTIWVIEDGDTGKIVGHHGLIPIDFSLNGKAYVAGKTENTILDPSYAGTGVYFLFEKEIHQKASKMYDFLLTTAGSGTPGKIRKRLGYESFGYNETFFYILCPKKLSSYLESKRKKWTIRSIGLRFFAAMLGVTQRASLFLFGLKRHGYVDILDGSLKDLQLIEKYSSCQLKKFLTIKRSDTYLKWRLIDNPYTSHKFFVARNKEEILGWVVVSVSRKSMAIKLVDVVIANDDANIFMLIMSVLTKYYKNRSHIEVFCLDTMRFFRRMLMRSGFISYSMLKLASKEDRDECLVKIFNDSLRSELVHSEGLYYTGLFFEGID